jgi:hypothetical protein
MRVLKLPFLIHSALAELVQCASAGQIHTPRYDMIGMPSSWYLETVQFCPPTNKQTRSYLTFPQLEPSHFEVQSPSTFIV